MTKRETETGFMHDIRIVLFISGSLEIFCSVVISYHVTRDLFLVAIMMMIFGLLKLHISLTIATMIDGS